MTRRLYLSLFLSFLSLFLMLSGCSEGKHEVKRVAIPVDSVTVIDGDTIKVKMNGKEDTVRLLLVDTPETHHPRLGKQPFGEEAKRFTERMIENAKTIELEKDVSERDKFGRFLAYVYVDGKSLQEELLKNGLARVAYVYQPNVKYVDEYEKIQKEAQKKGVGIWQWENYVQKDGFHREAVGFVASKNSDVYHPADCDVVNEIKPENRIYFMTEQEAQASGRHRSQVEKCWVN
ncbi:thermonuclease family protein [Polycladomyces zharkentensis]|uniref:thermonuclease family protein n=1 Tax=Polycladomyces zharkentensis TaxID=2807616 RepID=UPI002FF96EED